MPCCIGSIANNYEQGLNWDRVVARATSWEWQRGVFLALSAAQQLLDAQIPAHVLERLNQAGQSQFATDELQALLFPEQRHLLNSPTGHFLNFLTTPRLAIKLRLAGQRLFLSRQEMAIKYAVEAYSPWIYPYYAIRLKDLVAGYTRKTWRMEVDDPAMLTISKQQARLQR